MMHIFMIRITCSTTYQYSSNHLRVPLSSWREDFIPTVPLYFRWAYIDFDLTLKNIIFSPQLGDFFVIFKKNYVVEWSWKETISIPKYLVRVLLSAFVCVNGSRKKSPTENNELEGKIMSPKGRWWVGREDNKLAG